MHLNFYSVIIKLNRKIQRKLKHILVAWHTGALHECGITEVMKRLVRKAEACLLLLRDKKHKGSISSRERSGRHGRKLPAPSIATKEQRDLQ